MARWIIRLSGVVLGLLFGCSGTTGHLAVVSTQPLDLEHLDLTMPSRHVIGRSCIDLVVVYPLDMPNFGNAVAEALRAGGGMLLTDVRIGYTIRYVPFVYGKACYVVEGDAR